MPHECETSLAAGTVRDRPRWRSCTGGAAFGCLVRARAGSKRRARGCIRTQIRAATEPRSIGENVRIGQRRRAATGYIPKRLRLQWLIVILAPLEIVDRCWIAR